MTQRILEWLHKPIQSNVIQSDWLTPIDHELAVGGACLDLSKKKKKKKRSSHMKKMFFADLDVRKT